MGTTESHHALQVRQAVESDEFRRETFRQLLAIVAKKSKIPFTDRDATEKVEREMSEFKLAQSQGWVALYERHLKEIADSPDAVIDDGHVRAIRRGLHERQRIVIEMEALLA